MLSLFVDSNSVNQPGIGLVLLFSNLFQCLQIRFSTPLIFLDQLQSNCKNDSISIYNYVCCSKSIV